MMSAARSETRFAVLIFTDIVGSTELKTRHGVPAYSAAIRVHNDHFESSAREGRGIRILQNLGDGYFAEADSVAEAVRFALVFQDVMRVGPWGEIRLATRVGIHAGEVTAVVAEGGSGIVAPAADLAARVMHLAVGGQILLTRFPFDEARHFLRAHPAVLGRASPPLRWLAHGPYLFKGRAEPLEIFEVGAEGLAPLTPPPDVEKARRAVRPGDEETLGWRPAIGLEIPGRPGWRLIEKLGSGGFGEVWTGEHAKLHQRRAFKFCFDEERLRALKREVTLVRLLRTALGDRDDIVRLHELKLDQPPFYLESDLAPHGNLLQWAEKQGGLAAIPLAHRIALVAHTATALAAAHSIGVLHKDIKPTNILVFDAPDGIERPRLVDFGIGTLANPEVLGQHGITAVGFTRATIQHSTGTPTYSPPEYLAGKPYTVQGDIYGLGVLLYQLLTADSSRPIAPGWERDITDPLLRADIAACVDGDPARRLTSAADLADRLLHLDQRRAEIAEQERLTREVAAHAEAAAAVAAARVRATRLLKLAAAFAVLALLAVGGGLSAWKKNTEYRDMLITAARSDRLIAEEKLRLRWYPEAFAYLARACEYDPPSTLAAEKAVAALGNWNYALPTVIFHGHTGWVHCAQFSPDGKRIVTGSDDKTAQVWDAATGRTLTTLTGHTGMVIDVRFSPDGKRILTGSEDSTARVWDVATGKTLATLAGHEMLIRHAEFSPDGTRIVTSSEDKTARVWDTVTGKMLMMLAGHERGLNDAHFSPDGTRIVTAASDGTARVWDAVSGKPLATFTGHKDKGNVFSVEFSPDGKRAVTTSSDRTAQVWDASNGQLLTMLAGHSGSVSKARFSPDGSRVVTSSEDKTARVWDAASGKVLVTFSGHELGVRDAEFSPDGMYVVTASADWMSRLWDATTGRSLATLAGHGGEVGNVMFSPDGKHILTVPRDKTARVWDAVPAMPLATVAKHAGPVTSAEFSADGARIITTAWQKTSEVRDAATGKILATFAGHERGVHCARFSPDGRRAVSASENAAYVWDAGTGMTVAILTGHTGAVMNARFSPDSMRVVTASYDKTARVWDAATGKTVVTLVGHTGFLWDARFSPNGKRIVTASLDRSAFEVDASGQIIRRPLATDRTARVWDAVTGKMLATLASHEQGVVSAEFSPDGKLIVTASEDRTARVWDAVTGKMLVTLGDHGREVASARFSPDGRQIVTAALDRGARIWDATTGQRLALFIGHDDALLDAQFSPDGARIVTASKDKTARIWDAATGRMVARLVGHEEQVECAQFSPDGDRIVTASQDKTARVWEVLPKSAGPPPEWFPDFLRYLAQVRLNADGELVMFNPSDWLALRERMRGVLRASAQADTPYLRILRKYVRE